MISKCANPGCSVPFHYLREGKVFRLQVDGGKPQLVGAAAHVEHFWLCGPCASTMTLVVDHGRVVPVALNQVRFRRAAAS